MTQPQKDLASIMELNYNFMSLQDAYNEFPLYSTKDINIAHKSINWIR